MLATSASFGATTAELGKRIADNPGSAALANVPGVLALAGSVPVKVGNEVIGAIGVSGAKGEACGNAGIATDPAVRSRRSGAESRASDVARTLVELARGEAFASL